MIKLEFAFVSLISIGVYFAGSSVVQADSAETKLTASDGMTEDWFGFSLAMSADGDSVIVGAYRDDSAKGAVYIYDWDGTQWKEAKLTAGDGMAADYFGRSVAMSADGNSVIVGAFADDLQRGAAYLYDWDGSQWRETKLTASDGVASDQFGNSVAMSANGSRVIVGAWQDESSKGAAYFYNWDGSQWMQTKLSASDGVAGDRFGNAVAMSANGNRAIVGAWEDESRKGAVYIYNWDGSQWMQTKLSASDGAPGDYFGRSVAMSAEGDSVIVGAYRDDSATGAAYVYNWDGTQWAETKLTASDGVTGDVFGFTVSMSADGGSVVVGAHFDDSQKGAAYVYDRGGTQWVETKLTASDGAAGDQFGYSVAMSADSYSVIVGAVLDGISRGSAYVYVFEPSDTDGDGVPDNIDAFPNSDVSPTIIINGEDTGIKNILFGGGATVSDSINAVLATDSKNSDFVFLLLQLKDAGAVSGKEMGLLLKALM